MSIAAKFLSRTLSAASNIFSRRSAGGQKFYTQSSFIQHTHRNWLTRLTHHNWNPFIRLYSRKVVKKALPAPSTFNGPLQYVNDQGLIKCDINCEATTAEKQNEKEKLMQAVLDCETRGEKKKAQNNSELKKKAKDKKRINADKRRKNKGEKPSVFDMTGMWESKKSAKVDYNNKGKSAKELDKPCKSEGSSFKKKNSKSTKISKNDRHEDSIYKCSPLKTQEEKKHFEKMKPNKIREETKSMFESRSLKASTEGKSNENVKKMKEEFKASPSLLNDKIKYNVSEGGLQAKKIKAYRESEPKQENLYEEEEEYPYVPDRSFIRKCVDKYKKIAKKSRDK